MHKPVVANRYLDKIAKEKENDYMAARLNAVKAKINVKCPESFYFYKTQFKKTQMWTNELKEYEVKKNNQILVDKLMNVFAGQKKNDSKKKKPKFTFKDNLTSQTRKWELYKITQDNQHLLKRLNERESFYNTKKWERDYNKSQIYKKNICLYPSIEFKNSNSNSTFSERFPLLSKQGYSGRSKSSASRDLLTRLKSNSKFSKTEENFFYSTNTNTGEDVTNFNINNSNNNPSLMNKKFLFSKSAYLGDLSHSIINFYVKNKKFVIEIESNSKGKIYYIIIEDVEEIVTLQKHYKKYEQIINDLDYDSAEEKVRLTNKAINLKLRYESKVKQNDNIDKIINKDILQMELSEIKDNELEMEQDMQEKVDPDLE